jgi:hypothetical protein
VTRFQGIAARPVICQGWVKWLHLSFALSRHTVDEKRRLEIVQDGKTDCEGGKFVKIGGPSSRLTDVLIFRARKGGTDESVDGTRISLKLSVH